MSQLRKMRIRRTISALHSIRQWRFGAYRCAWSGVQPAGSTDHLAAHIAQCVTTVWRYENIKVHILIQSIRSSHSIYVGWTLLSQPAWTFHLLNILGKSGWGEAFCCQTVMVEIFKLCVEDLVIRLSPCLYADVCVLSLLCFESNFLHVFPLSVGFWSPLSVGEQLYRQKELPLFLPVPALSDNTHNGRLWLRAALYPVPHTAAWPSALGCHVSFWLWLVRRCGRMSVVKDGTLQPYRVQGDMDFDTRK